MHIQFCESLCVLGGGGWQVGVRPAGSVRSGTMSWVDSSVCAGPQAEISCPNATILDAGVRANRCPWQGPCPTEASMQWKRFRMGKGRAANGDRQIDAASYRQEQQIQGNIPAPPPPPVTPGIGRVRLPERRRRRSTVPTGNTHHTQEHTEHEGEHDSPPQEAWVREVRLGQRLG